MKGAIWKEVMSKTYTGKGYYLRSGNAQIYLKNILIPTFLK